MKNYRIVYPNNPSPAEKTSAEQLSLYLEKMSGFRLPVISDSFSPDACEICVGETNRTRKEKPENREGYFIYSEKQKLFILGGSDRGTLYGVFDYLRLLGCGFYAADTELIPERKDLVFPEAPIFSAPAFEYRDTFWSCSYETSLSAKLHLNGCVGDRKLPPDWGCGIGYAGHFVHSLPIMVPPDTYFESHPEYYSMINGERTGKRLYSQLCLTNEDLYPLVKENVKDWLRQHPEAKIISVSQDDAYTNETYCTCPECTRVNQEEQTPGGTLFRFVNRIAEDLEKEFPDIAFDTLAYQYSVKPPVLTKPRKNVIIRYCTGTCSFHAVTECDENAYIVENIKDWNRICDRIYIWNYTTNFAAYLSPYPNFDSIPKDIRFFASHGVKGLFEQGMYNDSKSGEFGELRAYCMARLMWEPQLEMKELMHEFCLVYYGAAAEDILLYIDLLQKRYAASGKHMRVSFVFTDMFDREILNEETVKKFDMLWAHALAVTSGRENEHVRRSQLSWRFAKCSLGYSGEEELAIWKKDCEALGVTRYNEALNFSDL